MRRNAAIVLGNVGNEIRTARLDRRTRPTPNEVVREAAAWAVANKSSAGIRLARRNRHDRITQLARVGRKLSIFSCGVGYHKRRRIPRLSKLDRLCNSSTRSSTRGVLAELDRTRAADAIALRPGTGPARHPDGKRIRQGTGLDAGSRRRVRHGVGRSDANESGSRKPWQGLAAEVAQPQEPNAPFAAQRHARTVATADPYDVYALDELQHAHGSAHPPGSRVVPRDHPTHQVALRHGRRHRLGPRGSNARTTSSSWKTSRRTTANSPSRPNRRRWCELVNEFLVEAANERASDIHLEHEEGWPPRPVPGRRPSSKSRSCRRRSTSSPTPSSVG